MTLAATQANSAGITNLATGRRSGTRVAADFTITLGFIPRYFVIENLTDRVKCEWFDGMNQGDSLKTIANGTRTLETSDGVIVRNTTVDAANGVSGTVNIDVSVDGIETDDDQIQWMAQG